jgi:cytoskeletal protein CcmA (bactofilin family)
MGIFNRGGKGDTSSDDRPLGGSGSTPAPTTPPAGATRPRRNETNETSTKGGSVANIGKSIVFKGELSGDEDLQIDGQVEGNVSLPGNELTVGPNGQVDAEIHAKSVQVIGKVSGNVIATERVEVHSTGHVKGDIRAPKLLIQEGAVVNGSIQMTEVGAAATPKSNPNPPQGERKTA